MFLPTSVLLILFLVLSLASLQKSYHYSFLVSSNGLPWERIGTQQGISKVQCAVHCSYNKDCISVHYNGSSSTCLLLKPQSVCSSGWTLPNNVEIFRRHEETLVKLDVFRVSSGLGSPVFNAWVQSSYQSTCDAAVYDLHQKINFTYKHPIVQHWNTIKKHQVHFTLWKNATVVVRIVFDCRDSTLLNWFSHNRILHTSFADLMGLNNADVSLPGFRSARRFYVNYEHRGCAADKGWVCVMEWERICAWEVQPPYPAFIYSTSGHYTQWQAWNELGLADDLVISMIIEI